MGRVRVRVVLDVGAGLGACAAEVAENAQQREEDPHRVSETKKSTTRLFTFTMNKPTDHPYKLTVRIKAFASLYNSLPNSRELVGAKEH
jgi:hypothetical protein